MARLETLVRVSVQKLEKSLGANNKVLCKEMKAITETLTKMNCEFSKQKGRPNVYVRIFTLY
jgi:hypothetical protein